MIRLAERMQSVKQSPTLLLNAKIQSLQSQGHEVINFTVGEADFLPPDVLKSGAIQAVHLNECRYTPVAGNAALRSLIAEQASESQGLSWEKKNVIVSHGAKQAIFNAILSFAGPGDQVLFSAPYWVSYPDMIGVAGATPVAIPTSFEEGFKLTAQKLKSYLNPQVKMLILNSPNNPTGIVYSREEQMALAQVLKDWPSVVIVSDEIYDQLYFESPPVSFVSAAAELSDRVITVNGLSKSAAISGWRLGWAVAAEALIEPMAIVQGQTTSGVSNITQAGAQSYFQNKQAIAVHLALQRENLKKKRNWVLETLEKNRTMKWHTPEAAFFFFLGLSGIDSNDFAQRLLQEQKVAAVSGVAFGVEGFFRISFAVEQEQLQEGVHRILRFCSSFSSGV